MRRAMLLAVLAISVALGLGAGTSQVHAAAPATMTFGSNVDWVTLPDRAGVVRPLGGAQLVCMNSFSPFPCPVGATVWNAPFSGWFADRSSIPGAEWIWAPGVDGSSAPADLASYLFTRTIVLEGTPTYGSLSLAADDFAEVWVNGRRIGSVGSFVDAGQAGAHNFLTTFDITARLRKGSNLVVVRATNGPAFFSPFCTSTCTYAQNPAGVLFGGSITTG